MKLTREQLLEIDLALHFGLSGAAWEGVTDKPWWELSGDEKDATLAVVRAAAENAIRQRSWDPHMMELNQHYLERLNPASLQADEAKQREFLTRGALDKRTSLEGLRMAVNDSLSHVHYWDHSQRLAVERRLAAKNLPTLAILSAMLRKKHERILERGKISTEEEYYLVQEILAALDFPVSEEDRRRLTTFAGDFESRLSG